MHRPLRTRRARSAQEDTVTSQRRTGWGAWSLWLAALLLFLLGTGVPRRRPAGRSVRRVGRHLLRGHPAPRRDAGARRQHRRAAVGSWPAQGRELGRIRRRHARAAVRAPHGAIRRPGPRQHPVRQGGRSGDRAADRLQPAGQLRRPLPQHLDGWPAASLGAGPTQLHGLLHRAVGAQHPGGQHHPHEDGLPGSQRHAEQRAGQDDGVLHPPRRPADGSDLHPRPGVPQRPLRPQHRLRLQPDRQRRQLGRVRTGSDRGRVARQTEGLRAAPPAGRDGSEPRAVPHQPPGAARGRARRHGHDLSGIRRQDEGSGQGRLGRARHAEQRGPGVRRQPLRPGAGGGTQRHPGGARAGQGPHDRWRRRQHRRHGRRRRRAAGEQRLGQGQRQGVGSGAQARTQQADPVRAEHRRPSRRHRREPGDRQGWQSQHRPRPGRRRRRDRTRGRADMRSAPPPAARRR